MACQKHFNSIEAIKTVKNGKYERLYRRWWKRSADVNGVKETFQVPITSFVVMSVFYAVDKHSPQTSVIQSPDALSGGDGILAGAEMPVEGVSDGGEDDVLNPLDLEELGPHDPHSKVDHWLDGRGMEDGGGAEEVGGWDVGEEGLDVVEVEGGWVQGGAEDGLGRRLRVR